MKFFGLIILSLIGLVAVPTAVGEKILAVFPYPGPSQYILVVPYLKALAERGHEVTIINTFESKENVQNIQTISAVDIHEHYLENVDKFVGLRTVWQQVNFFRDFFKNSTVNILDNDKVKELLRSNKTFDVVIVETFMVDALYGLAQHFNAHLVGINSFGTDSSIDELIGNTSPVSYIPGIVSGFTDRMNFWQRLQNFWGNFLEWIFLHAFYLPSQCRLYEKYFPNASMDFYAQRKNFSIILLNQHFSLSYPRPYVPNMIEVGGFHINHKAAALPADMAAFINESKHDVIYFSMGSNLKSANLAPEKLQILLETFGSLKQRVLWKFENPNLPNKPDNVFISKWFPQPDILAHPKVKLFITHSGLLSTIEAMHHGKPVVAIPMFYDQFLNAARIEAAGLGLVVDFKTLSKQDLHTKIERVLNEKSFMETATKISRRYHDQPMKPLDKAIYWTEYVLRHEGAAHMRSAAQNLNLLQYLSLDVIGFIVGALALLIITIVFVCKKVFNLFFVKRNVKNISKKEQ